MCVVFDPDDTTRPNAFEAPCPILITLCTENTYPSTRYPAVPHCVIHTRHFLAALDELFLVMDTALLLAMFVYVDEMLMNLLYQAFVAFSRVADFVLYHYWMDSAPSVRQDVARCRMKQQINNPQRFNGLNLVRNSGIWGFGSPLVHCQRSQPIHVRVRRTIGESLRVPHDPVHRGSPWSSLDKYHDSCYHRNDEPCTFSAVVLARLSLRHKYDGVS
jgi:hypothetical protein